MSRCANEHAIGSMACVFGKGNDQANSSFPPKLDHQRYILHVPLGQVTLIGRVLSQREFYQFTLNGPITSKCRIYSTKLIAEKPLLNTLERPLTISIQ